MTGLYEYFPMPHKLDVLCPHCGHLASFEFAEAAAVHKNDLNFFKKNKTFTAVRVPFGYGFKNAALYYHGFHGITQAAKDIPSNYPSDHWAHSRYLQRRSNGEPGTVLCNSCFLRQKTSLVWPEMAFFKIDVRGQTLWAFHRESAQDLYDFVASKERQQSAYRWAYFLRHVPGRFLDAKLRDEVCRKLLKLLS